MRALLIGCAALLVAAGAARAQDKFGLPELHAVKTATLAPPYSCRSAAEFKGGYEGTALFLSAYSEQRNSPDLLFNGACGGDNYFEAATAGNDLAMLADLGTGLLVENISAQDIYMTLGPRKAPFVQETRYVSYVPVKLNHTYAVVLNKSEVRGVFVFTVTAYEPDKRVELRYAVKNYQVQQTVAASAGFDWGKTSH
ncbi:MAG TPA: hypothetical protein VF546_07155 [Pyrinomonadaceae bacterium]|jgi:hypothetical protein